MTTIIAIDPGTSKCGIAVVRSDQTILHRAIARTEDTPESLRELALRYPAHTIVVGNGTSSSSLVRTLKQQLPHLNFEMVDESNSSEIARKRYCDENRPRGWQILLPHSLRTPDKPYDDYVAVELAERYFKSAGTQTS